MLNARGATEAVACNLCGADDFDVLFNSPMEEQDPARLADYVASTNRYDRYGRVVRCRRCTLVYTNPRLSQETLRAGYAGSVDTDYAAEDASRSINAHIALRTIRKFVRTGRLLDVGCSTGYFLNAARLDFEVHGIEPSRWAADHARERLRLEIQHGNLEDVTLSPGSLDVVSMNDVIEHFSDPREALQRVHRLLKPGGLLYLVTPDISGLAARVLRGKWWGLRPAHLYYFSRATLARLLEQTGFRPVLTRSYGRIFTYGYWLSRLEGYPSFVHGPIARAIAALDIHEKLLYLDTRDSVELCAVKEPVDQEKGA
jgi:2-polyprenyl-3-methyl-5-hydroxy-6-metoxy-1,4-benzoquinol methylase